MKLFGTNGIRGPADKLFTSQFCRSLGYVFGTWLIKQAKTGQIAVAMDPRDSSPRIKKEIITGLAAVGWEIEDQGVIPTPALTYYHKSTPHLGGAVMVTGSHISSDLNGVKLFIDGEEVTKIHEPQIEALFESLNLPATAFTDIQPVITFSDSARQMYFDMLKKLADTPYPDWTVVLDTANGTQSEIMPQLLSDLGLKVILTRQCNIQSPYFVPRDTETESSFTDAIRQIVAEKADLGIGFDIDGDRVIFMDELGRYLPGDYSCSLIALREKTPVLVTPISTCSVVDYLGKKVIRTPVGATHVISAMKQHASTFGFEPNGGGISAEIFYGRDGGSTLIKLLNLLKKRSGTLSQAYDSLPRYFLFRDKIDCPFSSFPQIYAAVKDKYSQYEIDSTDGLKVALDNDSWILFRGSGNAPEFRVFVQSKQLEKTAHLGQDGLNWVKSLISSPNLPVFSHQAVDSLNVLSSVESFPKQCAQVIRETALLPVPPLFSQVKNIVISGMGGSALGGQVIMSLERQIIKVPIIISNEFHLPNFVGNDSLVIVSSYSGNTEETIYALKEAQVRRAQIFILTSGGRLAAMAHDLKLPHYIFDPKHNPSRQPRLGLGYNLVSLISFLIRCQLLHPIPDFNTLPRFLTGRQQDVTAWKIFAQKLLGKIPVLISSEHLKGGVQAFRNQLHENSKTFALVYDIPELNHHLLEGLQFPSSNPQNLLAVFFHSGFYHPENSKRFPLTQAVFASQKIPYVTFSPTGPNRFFETLDLIQSSGYIAYYLALYNHIDPGPIPWVDWYKDELEKL